MTLLPLHLVVNWPVFTILYRIGTCIGYCTHSLIHWLASIFFQNFSSNIRYRLIQTPMAILFKQQCLLEVAYFLPHDAMPARYMPWSGVCPSVCLSVRPSVRSRCSVKTAKHTIKKATLHDGQGILYSFVTPKITMKFQWSPKPGWQVHVR